MPIMIKVGDLTATENLNGSVEVTDVKRISATCVQETEPLTIPDQARLPLALLLLQNKLTENQLTDITNQYTKAK